MYLIYIFIFTVTVHCKMLFERMVLLDNSVIQQPVLGLYNDSSIGQCARTCIANSFCLSIFYNHDTKVCVPTVIKTHDRILDADVDLGSKLFALKHRAVEYPGTCSELQTYLNTSADSEYWLYPHSPTMSGNRARIHCHAMNSSTPTEFVSLTHANVRVYPPEQNRWCAGVSYGAGQQGITTFNKIRVKPETMTVVTDDYTFATWTGTRHGYGAATDCYNNYYGSNPCGPLGTFNIDTRGTGLLVDPQVQWVGYDWRPYIIVNRSSHGRVINLNCGGWCGGCVPDRPIQLHYNPNERLDHDAAFPATFDEVSTPDS